MEIKTFNDFGINRNFIEKFKERKITIPTEIQREIIPRILSGKDVIGQSRTGTGKTIAYLIPLLQLIISKKATVLIIAPTKELSIQIYNEALYYADGLDIKTVLLTGGENIIKQSEALKKGFDIIVAVPGRLIKLIEEDHLKLSSVKKVVLDEADFLIDLGFLKDVEKIFSYIKNLEQLMIFSATLSAKTKRILDIVKNQKISVRVDSKNSLPQNIENYFFPIQNQERISVLLKIIDIISPFLSIIFVRTKEESRFLYLKLKEKKINVGMLNGDMAPSLRKKVIKDFKSAKLQYLVSTDLASRGLDLESITHIINYTLPVDELDYLHRAGRTARMNDKGIVYSLCNEIDEAYLKKYAINLGFDLKPVEIRNKKIELFKYTGVKPRFNLEEIKKRQKIELSKKKEKVRYADKKNRSKKRR